MTRSHALLHCPNPRLQAARAETWEGRPPGGVRSLLSNPRWEKKLLKLLELSGVGRIMADGTEEEEVRGARKDDWVIWEDGGRPVRE